MPWVAAAEMTRIGFSSSWATAAAEISIIAVTRLFMACSLRCHGRWPTDQIGASGHIGRSTDGEGRIAIEDENLAKLESAAPSTGPALRAGGPMSDSRAAFFARHAPSSGRFLHS